MRISRLFTRTTKDTARSDVSRNAQLLTRAGYVDRLIAGVYSFLPLGLRVLNKIEQIIREEMHATGSLEVLMPALQPKEAWEQTGRWDSMDVLYKLSSGGRAEHDLALGPTHEEIVTPLVSRFVQSYRDLPVSVFQLQTKFRNEPRAKSGLLRGREFRMKDMYSFHADDRDLDAYYTNVIAAYERIYARCGLGEQTFLTYASGGSFSMYSHEFQTVTPYGEDVIYRIPGTKTAINKEIVDNAAALAELVPGYADGQAAQLQELRAIEVGNIFKLGSRFTSAIGAHYTNANGAVQPVLMGCYGIGPSRLMGAIAECLSDENGLSWPAEVAPYQVHLIAVTRTEQEQAKCDDVYRDLTARGIQTLYDDRHHLRPGEKFSDADLIGIPMRIVVSTKTLAQATAELKPRNSKESVLVPIHELPVRLAGTS